jgi:hypothetical protein
VLRACLLSAVLLTGAACGKAPSKGKCEKLVDHLVELEAAAAGSGAMSDKGEIDQQKKKVKDSVGLDFCLKDMSVDQVECGLKARSLEELDKTCDQS